MNHYLKLLYEIYINPRHLQSDFCRYNARLVAEAASRGHITSLLAGISVNKWHITVGGMQFLNEQGWLEQ